jgi:hypothetical protein
LGGGGGLDISPQGGGTLDLGGGEVAQAPQNIISNRIQRGQQIIGPDSTGTSFGFPTTQVITDIQPNVLRSSDLLQARIQQEMVKARRNTLAAGLAVDLAKIGGRNAPAAARAFADGDMEGALGIIGDDFEAYKLITDKTAEADLARINSATRANRALELQRLADAQFGEVPFGQLPSVADLLHMGGQASDPDKRMNDTQLGQLIDTMYAKDDDKLFTDILAPNAEGKIPLTVTAYLARGSIVQFHKRDEGWFGPKSEGPPGLTPIDLDVATKQFNSKAGKDKLVANGLAKYRRDGTLAPVTEGLNRHGSRALFQLRISMVNLRNAQQAEADRIAKSKGVDAPNITLSVRDWQEWQAAVIREEQIQATTELMNR